MKSEKREGNAWFFLLHYSGWGKRYDEWVAQSGLVKYDADVVSADPPGNHLDLGQVRCTLSNNKVACSRAA